MTKNADCTTSRTKRDDILDTTIRLMERQGYHATGLNQIIRESVTPKGSLYHYFPGGKEELATEAIELMAENVSGHISNKLNEYADPAAGVESMLLMIGGFMEKSDFHHGGPLTTVASETATTNATLNAACRDAFQCWQDTFASYLRKHGMTEADADELGALIFAATEGAIIVCRTQKSTVTLRQIARQLRDLVAARHRVCTT